MERPSDSVAIIETNLPTYLKELLLKPCEIILIHDKKRSINSVEADESLNSSSQVIRSNSTDLDLTGNPLAIDLGGDESVLEDMQCENTPSWTVEESKQYPLKLSAGRAAVNKLLLKRNSANGNKPIFCVCDGTDNLRTVIIGGQHSDTFIMSCLVEVVGLFPKEHEYLTLQYMKKQHTKANDSLKVDYFVRSKYSLYGYNLQANSLPQNTQGSISIEATWKDFVYELPYSSTITLILQIIVGHKLSSFKNLWDELCQLQNYLSILQNPKKNNDETTVICENSIMDEADILDQLTDLLNVNSKTDKSTEEANRHYLLDNLWEILKGCKDLAILRDSIHFLFEGLVDAKIYDPTLEDNPSTITTIISGILAGKISVPTINFSKSLELLFELGTEKLKQDYLTIMNGYSYCKDADVMEMWRKFSINNPMALNHRKSSMNKALMASNTTEIANKLAYLAQLHTSIEFIYLVEEHFYLSDDTKECFFKKLDALYVEKPPTKMFSDLKYSPLQTFSSPLFPSDIPSIKSHCPISWSIEMFSSTKENEITTSFNVSKQKIIPTVVYDNYDVSEDVQCFFVTKLSKYLEYH